MPYNITAKSLCVKDEEEIVDNDYWTRYKSYMLDRSNRLREKQLLDLDDVEYNQKWWKWYCQENRLDVTTGKSLNSRFLYCNPLF